MKKVLCFFVLLIFVCLSGCGGSNVAVKPENLSFNFEIAHSGSSFLINALIKTGGDMEFTILSPVNIEGLTFRFSDTSVHTEFMGLKKDFPINNTDFGVLGKLHKAFSMLSGESAYKHGEELQALVSVDGQEFIFTVTDLGIPIGVSWDENKIEFKNILTQ